VSRYVDTSARLELERGVFDAYDYWSERLRLGFPLRIAPRWTLAPSYNIEVYQLSNVTEQANLNPNLPPSSGPQLQGCTGHVCVLSYLEERIAWDLRDDVINTRKGAYLALAVQQGFDILGYGYRYLRFLPEARLFFPVGPGLVLALRGRVGALIPIRQSEAPPIPARFTAGGPMSMRGYYTRRLSPMVLDTTTGTWVAVGGNGLLDGSLELRADLTPAFGLATFVDVGNVSDYSSVPSTYLTALDPSLLQWAMGVGLRYRTPFGPFRVDVAGRLPTYHGIPFSGTLPAVPAAHGPGDVLLAHQEPIVAVHITIGEAF
jgi:translocation and assembly module TamA